MNFTEKIYTVTEINSLSKEILENQDLIIGMEKFHLLKVRHRFKELREQLRDKMYTLKQFNGADKRDYNIPDPYMTGFENYNNIMKIVEENVEKLVKKIAKINASQ